MKTTRTVLWVLFPVSIITFVVLLYFHIAFPAWAVNLYFFITLLLPTTAMLLQTLYNKNKNTDKAYFLIKLVLIITTYAMLLSMFLTTHFALV